jgi:hemerythrin-like domain-containing protein
MTPTEELMQEHSAITSMLQILERRCSLLDAGKDVPATDIQKMMEFFKVFADGCHHAKEELHLFPALEQAGVPREHGPIGVMLGEHDLGRKYVRGMGEAFERYMVGEKNQARMFSQNARSYINLLVAHIEKENQVLFPLADRVLSIRGQDDLSRAF